MNKFLNKITYEIGMSILAFTAVFITVLDFMEKIVLQNSPFLLFIDYAILIIFIIDYFIRLYKSDNKKWG